MRRLPRIRAWRFSSATPSRRSGEQIGERLAYASKISSIATVSSRIPRRSATSIASVTDPGLEYGDGIARARTASGPRASAASVATSAESIPPESPSVTSRKPFLRT